MRTDPDPPVEPRCESSRIAQPTRAEELRFYQQFPNQSVASAYATIER